MTCGPLGRLAILALEKRCIDIEIASRLGIYSATSSGNGEVVPDEDGNIIVFPFMENGEVVAEKYRAAGKRFWQKAGGKRTFYNADALDDPALVSGDMALVITEGEIDCLSAMTVGFPLAVSVPDGAPPPPKEGEAREPSDLSEDSHGKFEFLWTNRERLKHIKKFVLAVDNDAPGKHLAEELVRRLQASRCYFVSYPEGSKDLNDVLTKHGPQAAHDVLANAKAYPLKGVYQLSDYPDGGHLKTFSTGWPTVDDLFRVFAPSFIVVTGIPASGKSAWLAHLLVNIAELHGWRSVVFSPEMPVIPHLRGIFRSVVGRGSSRRMDRDEVAKVDKWINSNVFFIDHEMADDADSDITLEWLLERAADAVLRYGVRILAIDPWNELEHARRPQERGDEYIGRALRMLKKFARKFGLVVIVLAHPTKEVGKDGKARTPTLYDIEGAAHWYNKSDIGIVVERDANLINRTWIYVRKVKYREAGRKGQCQLQFDPHSGRYDLLDPGPDYGDGR